jgi:hypothetical protein
VMGVPWSGVMTKASSIGGSVIPSKVTSSTAPRTAITRPSIVFVFLSSVSLKSRQVHCSKTGIINRSGDGSGRVKTNKILENPPMLRCRVSRFNRLSDNFHVSFLSVTVQVIPAAINTPAGTFVRRMRTGMRCANLTQVNVGLTLASSSGPFLLS